MRDAIERQRLVDSLVKAQNEMAALHDELASSQRESGVLQERGRLSRDIHDTLAQGFSSIVLLARGRSVLTDDAALTDLLAQIETTASTNLADARGVVSALAPSSLDGQRAGAGPRTHPGHARAGDGRAHRAAGGG